MIPRQATLQRALSQLGRGEEDSLSRSDLDRELPLRLACRECRMHGRACLSSNHTSKKGGRVGKKFPSSILSILFFSKGSHEGQLGQSLRLWLPLALFHGYAESRCHHHDDTSSTILTTQQLGGSSLVCFSFVLDLACFFSLPGWGRGHIFGSAVVPLRPRRIFKLNLSYVLI